MPQTPQHTVPNLAQHPSPSDVSPGFIYYHLEHAEYYRVGRNGPILVAGPNDNSPLQSPDPCTCGGCHECLEQSRSLPN